MRPEILAKSVSSLPRPTFRPGLTGVPRCRTMMVPPGTTCPPNALNPSRCAFESRPFREVPCPFLCAMTQSLKNSRTGYCPLFLFLGCGFFRRCFLGSSLLLRVPLRPFGFRLRRLVLFVGLYFFRLRFLLGQLRSLEALSVKSDFRDTHSGIRLPVSAQLLVLFLALVLEHTNLLAAGVFHHLPKQH